MVNYKWIKSSVPSNLKHTQVYGIAFSDDGRILLIKDENLFKLIGGHPLNNESYEETLKREFLEEINVELYDIHYLGYLFVSDKFGKYAQVRMIARIKDIHENRPDIDNGKIYTRVLCNISNIKSHLNYGIDGNNMLDDAIIMAKNIYNFKSINDKEQIV